MTQAARKRSGAVLVVGAGAAGVRCALDLAESGHDVCLVERSAAIGGHATRLDKVFPYNKCSVCTLTPKLKAVAQHPAIELLTNATLTDLQGDVGAYTASIRKRPLFVDPKTCSGCGDCVGVCPVTITDRYNDGLSQRKAIGKLYQHAIPNTHSVIKTGHSPCKRACPVHTSVQGLVDLVSARRYSEAFAVAARDNPFPSACGRVCDHECETACVRGEVDEPLALGQLARFVTDWAADAVPLPQQAAVRYNERVAVIGAGPAGMTAARELATQGYRTTVFETQPELGGTLRYSVPEFRLPKKALRKDIERITALGVESRCGQTAGRDFTVDDLLTQGYDAVLIATGRRAAETVRLPGSDLQGVRTTIDLLAAAAQNERPEVGDRVVVVGDDDAAFDAARTCSRLGATSVTLVASVPASSLTAVAQNQSAAAQEGVEVLTGLLPTAIIGESAVAQVRFRHCVPDQADETTRPQPATVDGQAVELACTTVLLPTLPPPAADVLHGCQEIAGEDGRIVSDPTTLATARRGVFAAGDAVAPAGQRSAMAAIADGRRAARSIHDYLRGEPLLPLSDRLMDEARPSEASLQQVPVALRVRVPATDGEQRRQTWAEGDGGYTEDQAVAEASRCLDCAVCGECLACVTACKPGALRHDARDQHLTRHVGAVVLATGLGADDFSRYERYGYGRYANVISSFGYERMLSPNGPTFSELVRPSDGAHPHRIAFIKPLYPHESRPDACTDVCDMYSTKEGMLARDHVLGTECDVFSVEMRPIGKGFEDFHREAFARGVRYVPAQPTSVREDPATGDLLVHWHDAAGVHHMDRYDLVVLSIAFEPPSSTAALAATLDVKLDKNGFCVTHELSPVSTSRDGVFAAGAITGPSDLPRSVAQASAAAAQAMVAVGTAPEHSASSATRVPAERDVGGEEPRVGVFVCRCDEMPDVVDVDATTEHAATLPSVVTSAAVLHACRADGLASVRSQIEEHKLNRVVVAGCSPRVKEPVFQRALQEAGLNPFLLEMANVREHVAWVHATHKEEATAKAQDLVRMAVGRVRQLQPLHPGSKPVTQSALIIGGGIAGMTAAAVLRDIGYPVQLVERSSRLGGRALDPDWITTGVTAVDHARQLAQRLAEDPLVKIHLDSELIASEGSAGSFISTVKSQSGTRTRIEHGAIILATGAREDRPRLYGLGDVSAVITQSDLAAMLATRDTQLDSVHDVAMVLCAGAHNESTPCCSPTACDQAIGNAIRLTERGVRTVSVWCREGGRLGVTAPSDALARATESGVRFDTYRPGNEPHVTLPGGTMTPAGPSATSGPGGLSADLLVLTTPTVPSDGTDRLAAILKLPLAADGFFSLSSHDLSPDANLLPVDFSRDGIFVCGMAEYPKALTETIIQAQAAAARAAVTLAKPVRKAAASVSEVDQDKCTACLTCVRVCPTSVPVIDPVAKKATIDPTVCKGCGVCVSQCPVKAITLHHYTDPQIIATEQALFTEVC